MNADMIQETGCVQRRVQTWGMTTSCQQVTEHDHGGEMRVVVADCSSGIRVATTVNLEPTSKCKRPFMDYFQNVHPCRSYLWYCRAVRAYKLLRTSAKGSVPASFRTISIRQIFLNYFFYDFFRNLRLQIDFYIDRFVDS